MFPPTLTKNFKRTAEAVLSLFAVSTVISDHRNMNISSIGAPTALEISTASFSDGLYCAFSRRMIVSRRTPTMTASSSCVICFNCLYVFNLHSKSGTPHSSLSQRQALYTSFHLTERPLHNSYRS